MTGVQTCALPILKTPYNPGERLPPEREIAEMLDVTRTVVREPLDPKQEVSQNLAFQEEIALV